MLVNGIEVSRRVPKLLLLPLRRRSCNGTIVVVVSSEPFQIRHDVSFGLDDDGDDDDRHEVMTVHKENLWGIYKKGDNNAKYSDVRL